MPEPIPLPTRQPRRPVPPPPPTDPRLQDFPLLPGEDTAAWTRHSGDVLAGLGPVDALERKLAAAVAVGMWREGRADRIEAEVLTDIGPSGAGRCHGSDLWQPANVAALGAALRGGCRHRHRPGLAPLPRPPQGQGRGPARAGRR